MSLLRHRKSVSEHLRRKNGANSSRLIPDSFVRLGSETEIARAQLRKDAAARGDFPSFANDMFSGLRLCV